MRKENNNLEYKPLLILFFHFWLFLYTCGNYRINKARARPPAPMRVHTYTYGRVPACTCVRPEARVCMPADAYGRTYAHTRTPTHTYAHTRITRTAAHPRIARDSKKARK